jgi:transglutaminase-like putative cysteine protease
MADIFDGYRLAEAWTSGAPVRERHVVVARGRDYADIPPLKGIYHGSRPARST